MLKSNIGLSTDNDFFTMGQEAAKQSTLNMTNVKCNFLFTSEKSDIKKIVEGVHNVTSSPIIGCTSSDGIIVPSGYISGENAYAGLLSLEDPNMKVGVSCQEAGKNPRIIGRKVAIEAVKNANSSRSPAYFCMIATPKDEEEYLMGIQDVIGRVPMFGGSAADDNIKHQWKIICNDQIINEGVAVAFFYTDNEINTIFTGAYRETNNMGLITKVKNNRTLVTIDGISSLKKYAHWINVSPNTLKGNNLLYSSILKPLAIKDPLGNITVIRHPMFGDDMGTKTTTDDTITLDNKVVEKTAIIQCEITKQGLINSSGDTLKELRRKTYREPSAYILFFDAGRKIGIGKDIDVVHKQLVKEAKGVPFICIFSFGEYGYNEHSSNICGGLMLSYTEFSQN